MFGAGFLAQQKRLQVVMQENLLDSPNGAGERTDEEDEGPAPTGVSISYTLELVCNGGKPVQIPSHMVVKDICLPKACGFCACTFFATRKHNFGCVQHSLLLVLIDSHLSNTTCRI